MHSTHLQNRAGCRQNWYDVKYDVSPSSCAPDVALFVEVHREHSRFARTLARRRGAADQTEPAERSASRSVGRVDTPVFNVSSIVAIGISLINNL